MSPGATEEISVKGSVTEKFLRKLLGTIRLTVLLKICYFWPHIPLALARIFHELLAATADMTVLPGVLGCGTLRRTVQVRLGIQPPAVAQWRSHLHGLATATYETSGLARIINPGQKKASCLWLPA